MEELLRHMEGKPYEMEPAIARYYRPEYCHEGTKDQCFVTAYEREDVIEEELQLCGYYCIITSAEMTAKEALELYKRAGTLRKSCSRQIRHSWGARVNGCIRKRGWEENS